MGYHFPHCEIAFLFCMVVHMASLIEIVGLLGTLNAKLFKKLSFAIKIKKSIKVEKNKQGLPRKR